MWKVALLPTEVPLSSVPRTVSGHLALAGVGDGHAAPERRIGQIDAAVDPLRRRQRMKVLIVETGPLKLTSNSVLLLLPGMKWISMPVMLGGNSTPSLG